MKDIRPRRGKYYIASLVDQGEHEMQDFKYAISDAEKIAHSISAFANARGGRLLIGVRDNGEIAGARRPDEDMFVVEEAAARYCSPPQAVTFTPYRCDGGAVVICAEVARAAVRPVMCRDSRGNLKAYCRVADENLPATALMIECWRQRDTDTATPGMALTAPDMALLALIDPRTGLLPDEAARRLHLTRATVEDSICRLYSAGVVDFAYIGGAFRLVPTDMI